MTEAGCAAGTGAGSAAEAGGAAGAGGAAEVVARALDLDSLVAACTLPDTVAEVLAATTAVGAERLLAAHV